MTVDRLEPRPQELEADIEYLSQQGRGFVPAVIRSSYGDLAFCSRVLDDYARLCDEYRQDIEDAYRAEGYVLIAQRCRKVSQTMAQAIGLDKAAAAKRCARQRAKAAADVVGEVGEDGITMLVQRGSRPQKKTAPGVTGTESGKA